MKELYYVTNIMVSWMTLDGLEGSNIRGYFIDRIGTKETKQFTCRKPFGIHFRCINKVEYYKNWRHVKIYLDMTLATKFWPDSNLAWYLAVSEFNTALASGIDGNYQVIDLFLPW